jgi:tRNA G18 (ribose-2'-O)-methylase SpoU
VIACGNARLDRTIARDGADAVQLEIRRTLAQPLKQLRTDGYQLVGLEQATGSVSLHDFHFARRTALVVGHERQGITPELLELLDHVVEIPVYGLPYSYNVATAAALALHEYCRQFPSG